MFWLIKQVFIVLLSFIESFVTKCVSINNYPSMTRPTLIDVNPIEFNYYSFMISLDKCNLSCNFVYGLSMKVCAPSQIKDVNVKVFNAITRMYEAKALVKHISCNCKCKFSGTTCNSNQK